MRKLVLLLPLIVATTACSSFSWQGKQSSNLTDEQKAAGIKDIRALEDEYESTTHWAAMRRRGDGRRNAFGRGLNNISETFGRHFLNYSKHDPYVNYPSNVGYLQHTGRFLTGWLGGIMPR